MNRAEADLGEFSNQRDSYLDDDEVPDTLVEVLRHIAKYFVPETKAAAYTIVKYGCRLRHKELRYRQMPTTLN